ncbi:Cysteine-rich membrane protein 2 [Spironucleus salmonicida]|uniref:Cysteine-rich membrane protein 2 n=1 Tax=Spironucleus salmonicida TaxID=348837 RepID=A0A9P8S0F9_9EUKA|nr:Cysteine-rich membrane protein 2 [Spironucleus salmonicida]
MTGTCDANLSSYSCTYNYSCMSQSTTGRCTPCSQITEGFMCRCSPLYEINCMQCASNGCAICIQFFQPLNNNSCVSNFCSNYMQECYNGYVCPPHTVQTTLCVKCQSNQRQPCKCGKRPNCSTCNSDGTKCGQCLIGYKLFEGNCVEQENVCDAKKQSTRCDQNQFCNGEAYSPCQNCSQLRINQFCRCGTKLAKNCQKCGDQDGKCKICIAKFALYKDECVSNICGMIPSTLNCSFGNLCREGSQPNAECATCDGTQACNCGSQLQCKYCGSVINTCAECFHGYHIEGVTCVRDTNSCGYQFDSQLCDTGFYCTGNFGDQCESCENIKFNNACKCGTLMIQNCTKCINNNCVECKSGLYPISNICRQNTCIGGKDSGQCALNNYCPSEPIEMHINCQECTAKSPIQCNCGGSQNCQTCNASYSGCALCQAGYQFASSECQAIPNICSKELTSASCSSGNVCEGKFLDFCVSCANINEDKFCNCNGNLLQNCKSCSGRICADCRYGYYPVNGKCALNICDQTMSNLHCLDGFICDQKGKPQDECSQCVDGQTIACKCGTAINCATCGRFSNTCDKCLPGLVIKFPNQSCGEQEAGDNSCDAELTSKVCFDNFFCDGQAGDICKPCSHIREGKTCKCQDQFLINCAFCPSSDCVQCINGFSPVSGKCVTNKCSTPCLPGYHCPQGAGKDGSCMVCSLSSTETCNCGDAKNCQTCNAFNNACQACIQGFVLLNGKCQLPPNCDLLNPCPIGQYCNNSICALCLDQQITCSCGQAVNCQNCGSAESCLNCIPGWTQDINGNCKVPICTVPPNRDQYCAGPESPQACSENPLVIVSMQYQCNCGKTEVGNEAMRCANCERYQNQCKQCMNGNTLMSGICVLTPPGYIGNCDQDGSSRFCAENYGCKGYGQCIECSQLLLSMSCKCAEDHLQPNCASCNGRNCVKCVEGAFLDGNQCKISCDNFITCEEGEMCKDHVCTKCDGTDICHCSNKDNCQECTKEQTCNGCMKGYIENYEGSCSLCADGYQLINDSPALCQTSESVQNFLGVGDIVCLLIALIIIIGGVWIIVYHYLSKPKKYYQQHNILAAQNQQ